MKHDTILLRLKSAIDDQAIIDAFDEVPENSRFRSDPRVVAFQEEWQRKMKTLSGGSYRRNRRSRHDYY